jgi:O-antigen ligase
VSLVSEERRLIFLLGILGPLTTLIVSPLTNLDPINPIKVLVVSTIAGGCFGIVLGMRSLIWDAYSKKTFLVLLSFPFFSLVAFIASDSNKAQQFFGVYGRNTGFLAYLILFIVLFSAGLVNTTRLSNALHFGMKYTSIAMLLYCLIQIAKLDPVKWSSFAPFGTLGNINFSSAFLGLCAVSVGLHSFSRKLNSMNRVLLGLYLIVSLFVIEQTGSIQGLLIFFLGYWTAITIWIFVYKSWKLVSTWLVFSLIFFALSVMGFLNRGPLSSFLYQDTNTFRFDYWHAGLKMIEHSPLIGHGFETYGDLYTQERGIISALRTGLQRTSNSAHNIFLDIGVNGGGLLLTSYILILFLAFLKSFKYVQFLKKSKQMDFAFLGLFSFWIAYLAQALISINQIGVGIWAWIITGLLLNVGRKNGSDGEIVTKRGKGTQSISRQKNFSGQKKIGVTSAIFGLIFTILGFAAGYTPVSVDSAFRKASDNASLNEMIDASYAFGANALIISKTVDAGIQNNYPDQVLPLIEKLTRDFPLDLYAWKMRARMPSVPESERVRALEKILELDPFFGCATANPLETFKGWIYALPEEKQRELADWWSITSEDSRLGRFTLSSVNQEVLDAKLLSLC